MSYYESIVITFQSSSDSGKAISILDSMQVHSLLIFNPDTNLYHIILPRWFDRATDSLAASFFDRLDSDEVCYKKCKRAFVSSIIQINSSTFIH